MQTSASSGRAPHVVVLGSEKGGSGKSTLAMHLAVALMKSGQRVATVDLDSRQQSLTRYMAQRRGWAQRARIALDLPQQHHVVERGGGCGRGESEDDESAALTEIVRQAERSSDFILVDTPSSDTFLMRIAHLMADTLVTPLNDSFVDFDVLGRVDPVSHAVTGTGHYADMVRDARRQRRTVDGAATDWVVLRNRLTASASPGIQPVRDALHDLSGQIGFRTADGIAERPLYRDLFPRGLTALDDLDEDTLGTRPTLAHLTARDEVLQVLDVLKLRLDEKARDRAVARAEWLSVAHRPLELSELVGN
jgi:chromosome partitioning protein